MVARTLTLVGPQARGSRVPALLMGHVLTELPQVIRRAVRMAFEGRSRADGPTPAWLKEAARVLFLGYDGTEETVLRVELPTLAEAAPRLYRQGELWPNRPPADDTGLDALGAVLGDIASANGDSERLDLPLLHGVAKFRKVLGAELTEIRWQPRAGTERVRITRAVADSARVLSSTTPKPQRVRLVGKLDMVRDSTSTFGLLLDDGTDVRGTLAEGSAVVASRLLARRVLVLGRAVFRPSGKLLRVDADELIETDDARSFFSVAPKPNGVPHVPPRAMREPARGAW